jgi:hypothetical protein
LGTFSVVGVVAWRLVTVVFGTVSISFCLEFFCEVVVEKRRQTTIVG